VVLEQNACVLPPGASTGFTFAKDSSRNYPNNDEVYGNDCETASQAFNQICFNIVGVTSITFGPNNRCENVYNCYQFPSDGSATGIHVLDPYLSITNNTQIKPNEPATAMVAIDNNGHNWTPVDALRHERFSRRQFIGEWQFRRLAKYYIAVLLGWSDGHRND
jgi:hypothetical protein